MSMTNARFTIPLSLLSCLCVGPVAAEALPVTMRDMTQSREPDVGA